MGSELQRQVVQAIRAGAGLVEIEQAIIDPAPVDEEHKAALWLYAEALRERPSLEQRELALLGS
jgi:hypothetical protein